MNKYIWMGGAVLTVAWMPRLLRAETLDGGVMDADGGLMDADEAETDESFETTSKSGPRMETRTEPDETSSEDEWEDDSGWGEDGSGWGSDDRGISATGSPKVSIHGLFENQLQGMWLREDGDKSGDLALNDYTKLRVDLAANLTGDVTLKADGVARIFAGKTAIPFTQLLPKKTRDALIDDSPLWEPFLAEKYRYENEYYINNAYLKLPVGPVILFIGKQPLAQGVGYAWNPTDVFVRKDIFDPTYEKPGSVALRAQVALGERVSLDLTGVPKNDFKTWIGGGRASMRAGPLTLSAVAYVATLKRSDMEGSLDAMQLAALTGQDPEAAIITHRGRRVLLGGEAVLDIEGVRLWTEGAYNFIEDKKGLPDDFLEIVGGVEYFFRTETHTMVEYLYYEEGPNQKDGFYRLNDWMGVLSGDLKMLGKHFLFEAVDHPVADFWTLGISSFQSLSDASAAVMGDVRWQFREDADLWFLVSYAVGQPNDYLSSARGQAWLRLTAYY